MIYQYNIISEINAGKVNLDRLLSEVAEVLPTVQDISKEDNTIYINFLTQLDISQKEQLDSIVTNHSGEPIPEEVVIQPEIDTEGRQITRVAFSNKGWHYQAHSVEFTTSTLNSIYNKDKNGNDLGFGEIKLYKSNGDEITTQLEADSSCVKTVVTWKPNFDFEIISGNVRQESKESFNMYLYVGLNTATGYPAPYNWFYVPFTQGGINMKYIGADEPLKTDGRASKYIKAGTNGDYFEIVLNHGDGNKHSMSIIFEIYKNPTS